MKKSLLLIICVSPIILIFYSSTFRLKETLDYTEPSSEISKCVTINESNLISIERFNSLYNQPGSVVKIRKNIYSLTTTEINAIKTGIANMKALPLSDPTSWRYQAAIHGTTLANNLPSWNSCHQNGAAFFFLAWHRMYVYFFERILRSKSGVSSLTIPYWNYQTNPVLHPAYRNSSPSNTLYDGSRNASINAGGSLPGSISTSINNALNLIPYYSFQGSINGPHGSVHVAIGGNMGSVTSAALDPVFWLHHGNIDRLWEQWFRRCNGRSNPTDNAWLTKTYTFFDENGNAVNMSGSQIINTVSQLQYRYDIYPFPRLCITAPFDLVFINKTFIRRFSPFVLNGPSDKSSHSIQDSMEVDNFSKQTNKSKFDFKNKTHPEKLMITLSNIKIDKMPEGIVEVYLNLPSNSSVNHLSKHFVGLLDLFSAGHHSAHGVSSMSMDDIELDMSQAAEDLQLTVQDLKTANLTFRVVGNSVYGREQKSTANFSIENIQFTLHQTK